MRLTKNRSKLDGVECRMAFTANRVDRNICRNNCAKYDRINKECKLGHNWKPNK